MSDKFRNRLIGGAIFALGLLSVNIWRGPFDTSARDESLKKMVHSSLTRFHLACQHLWEDQGPRENCSKETVPALLRESFDLPGIYISGDGIMKEWQATARHDLLMDQIFIVDASGNIDKLD